MTWKDDRNLGPWDFIEQPDKWGYLNNPRWVPTPAAPVNYTGRVLSEPQIWTPDNKLYPDGGSDEHHPCGHWHKRGGFPRIMELSENIYQQSIDVHHGRVAMAGMLLDTPDGGFACLEHSGGNWYALGAVGNTSQYMEPNTLRISSETGYVAYFASYYPYTGPNQNTNYIGIFRFDRGDLPRRVTAWESNWGTGIPYKMQDYKIYNKMDCYGSRLACAGYVLQVDGVNYNKYQIKVSNDSAMSFNTTWEFPTGLTVYAGAPYNQDQVYVRMSQDGIVWLVYLRSAFGTTNVELWESNAAATSWSKIWEKNFFADLNNSYAYGCTFDIDDTAGERMVIRLNGYDGANHRQVCYYSSNYGVAFTAYADSYAAAVASFVKGTANGPYVVHGYGGDNFYRSINGGDTWAIINVGGVLSGFYVDQQKHHGEIVYTECGDSLGGPDPTLISYLHSIDDGATWETIQTPFKNSGAGAPNEIPYFPNFIEEQVTPTQITITPIVGGVPSGSPVFWSSAPDLFNDPNRDIRWVRIF